MYIFLFYTKTSELKEKLCFLSYKFSLNTLQCICWCVISKPQQRKFEEGSHLHLPCDHFELNISLHHLSSTLDATKTLIAVIFVVVLPVFVLQRELFFCTKITDPIQQLSS